MKYFFLFSLLFLFLPAMAFTQEIKTRLHAPIWFYTELPMADDKRIVIGRGEIITYFVGEPGELWEAIYKGQKGFISPIAQSPDQSVMVKNRPFEEYKFNSIGNHLERGGNQLIWGSILMLGGGLVAGIMADDTGLYVGGGIALLGFGLTVSGGSNIMKAGILMK